MAHCTYAAASSYEHDCQECCSIATREEVTGCVSVVVGPDRRGREGKRMHHMTRRLLSGSAMIALMAYGQAGSAQAAKTPLDLPAQPLDVALNTVGVKTGSEILFSKDAVSGYQARALKGAYEAQDALAALLHGTGLRVNATSNNVYVVSPAPIRLAQATPPRRPPQSVGSSIGLETVVVTAERKSEDIQTVPIAITHLSQKELTTRQIAGGPDLVKEVPNLTFSKTNFTGYNLEIRGIGTQAISVTTDPAVAVAFNGIPFIRNHFFEQEFYDLDNVEILRGPQGTLWGRNATAGVVNILSAKPTGTYEAMASVDIGNYSSTRLEGMVNIPIVGDTLDIRAAGEWTMRSGYSFNTITNEHIDGRDLWSGRVTIGWKPSDALQTYLVWEHFSEDDDRMRTSKQLCNTSPIPATVGGVSTGGVGTTFAPGDYLSQGCQMSSLYTADAFQVPNGFSLAYYSGL